MRVRVDASGLRELTLRNVAVRFALGAAITAAAGLIARMKGPIIGGLFLAFPAILPASLTLIAAHQESQKARAGGHGLIRGRQAAALDAFGAYLGSIGLVAFALAVQHLALWRSPLIVLSASSVVWFSVGLILWTLRKRRNRSGPREGGHEESARPRAYSK
jgi:hypothetical protein